MFRTRATTLTHDLTPRTATAHVSQVRSIDLCLRWTARHGQLMARWEREPHDLAGGPRTERQALRGVTVDARDFRQTGQERDQ